MAGIRKNVSEVGDALDPLRVQLLAREAVLFDEVRVSVHTHDVTTGVYVVTEDDVVVLATGALSGGQGMDLPNAANVPGRIVMVRNNTTGGWPISFSNNTVDGAPGKNVNPGTAVIIVSDGTEWWTLADV